MSALAQFEQERINRRAALRKIGLTTGMALFAMFGTDDLARLAVKKLAEHKETKAIADSIAHDFKDMGVAFADGLDCTDCGGTCIPDDDYDCIDCATACGQNEAAGGGSKKKRVKKITCQDCCDHAFCQIDACICYFPANSPELQQCLSNVTNAQIACENAHCPNGGCTSRPVACQPCNNDPISV